MKRIALLLAALVLLGGGLAMAQAPWVGCQYLTAGTGVTILCPNALGRGGATISSSGGGGTPGGTNGQIQYNNSGAFGGFGLYDGTNTTVPNSLILGATKGVYVDASKGIIGFNTPKYPEISTDGASLANSNTFDGDNAAFTIHQGTQNLWPLLIWNDTDGITKGVGFSASDRAFGIWMGDGAGSSTQPFALTNTALTLTTSLTVGTRTGTPATFATFDSGGKLVAGGAYSTPAFIPPGGRCTLTSGTPVTTTDVTTSTNIYYTPYIHNNLWLYTSSTWTHYTFSEITIPLGTLSAGAVYDIFLYDSGGNVTAKISPAWTDPLCCRGSGAGTTELAQQDGAWVNNVSITSGPGAKAGLYVCSFYTISTTATADAGGGSTTQVGAKRFLNNMYNRVPSLMAVKDTTDSWSYTTGTVRRANGATVPGNSVEFLIAQPWELVDMKLVVGWFGGNNSARGAQVGFGLDSSALFSGVVSSVYYTPATSIATTLAANYTGYPGLGYHYLVWNEYGSDGTSTFQGDQGTSVQYSAAYGWKSR